MLYNYTMQNIVEEDDQSRITIPTSKAPKRMTQIINNRYLNQNIYAMFLQKRFDECLELISKCQPDEFKIYIKSLVEKARFRLDSSLELLNQCHIMNKINFDYLKCIAKNYYLLGKYKSSLEVAKDAIKMQDSDYEIYYIMGKIALALDDKDIALMNFKKSIGKEPNEEAYIQQAKIHMQKKEYRQATQIIKQSINFFNENANTYEMIATCYLKQGNLGYADENYKLALEIDCNRYISLLCKGTILQERGQINQALEMYKRAYKTSNNSAVLWNDIGICMHKNNKNIAAYSCFKRALFLDPFKWDIQANLALLFINKKLFLPAEIHLRSALKLNKDPVLLNLLGVCLSELKDYNNAEKSFKEALKMNSTNQQAQFNLLICYLKKKDNQKGKDLYYEMTRSVQDPVVRQNLMNIKKKVQSQ